MVSSGKVEGHRTLGKHKAGVNADKGSMEEDKRLHDSADHYSHRQRYYAIFIQRVKRYIIGMRKAEKEVREKMSKGALKRSTVKRPRFPHGLNWNSTEEMWGVNIFKKGKIENLGLFENDEEAALKYDEEAAPLGLPLNFLKDAAQDDGEGGGFA